MWLLHHCLSKHQLQEALQVAVIQDSTRLLMEWTTRRPVLTFQWEALSGLPSWMLKAWNLLPGASSALYGPGGMNGTLLINSKNPFKYQGLSFQIKTGIMHTDGQRKNRCSLL